MSTQKSSKFGIGLLIGATAGALAALFLTPQSGKENKELVKKKYEEFLKMLEEHEVEKKTKVIFGDVTEEGTKLYEAARVRLSEKMKEVQKVSKDMDREEFVQLVGDTLAQVTEEAKASLPKIKQLQDYFVDQWEELKKTKKT
ncbi:hypothetical protein HGA88_02360 [Candidatus Roizmanbacteria bacterium]|nr:hypothetical protein [Candidatus Roizmanbacteria bacterium]